MSNVLLREQHGEVLALTINRPRVRNAIDANRVDAVTAAAIGLVDELSERGHVLNTALARAQLLCTRAAPALAGIKAHFRIDEAVLRTALERERDIQIKCFASAEFIEGTRAFGEKRAPDFRAAVPRKP